MPVYVYECQKCKHSYEEYKSFSTMYEPLKQPCPQCREKKLKLGLTAPAAFLADTNLGPGSQFKERMKQIGDACPGNTISHHY